MKYRADLEKYYKKYNSETSQIKDIAKEIFKKHKEIKLSEGSIYNYLCQIKRENQDVLILDNKSPWSVDKKDYVWTGFDNKIKRYSIDLIDKLFLNYSKSGYNLSRTSLCNKFELDIKSFNEIQRVFLLYKDANILSPYTIQNTPTSELKVIMENQITKVIRSGEYTEKKYKDKIVQEYKEVINKDNINILRLEEMMHDLSAHLPKLNLNSFKTNKNYVNDDIVVCLADLHVGAKNHEPLKITDDYSIEIAKEKLTRAAEIINSYKSKRVTISFLGDLIESLSGLNHPNSWQFMEPGVHGWKAVSSAYELVLKFLNSIENLHCILGVGGNHDRSAKSNEEADTLVTDAIFYMLKEYYKKSNVTIIYDASVVSITVGKIGYIFSHGHLGLHKRKASDIILDFAVDPKLFQFIVNGHWHTRILNRGDDTNRARKMTCPSIFTGNKFSDEEVGASCKSGILIFGCDNYNEPYSIDRSL